MANKLGWTVLGALIGMVLRVVFDWLRIWWKEKRKQQDERQMEEKAQNVAAKMNRIHREGLASKVLLPFYNREDLTHSRLSEYVISTAGTHMHTGVVTREEWRNLNLDIAHENHSWGLREDASPCRSLSGQQRSQQLAALRREGRRITDSLIFRLLRLNTNGHFKMEFALDTFYNFLCSTGALERELHQTLVDTDLDVDRVLKNKRKLLPLRYQFLPDCRALLDFESRFCAGGAHTLMALKRPKGEGDDFVFFAKRRSKAVASGESLMSLLPMGYHTPTSESTAGGEVPLVMSVYRETYEELFGGKEVEAEEQACHLVAGWYLNSCYPLAWLMQNPESFTIEIVSLGLSLMHGNYEIAVLFAVTDPRFWKQFSGAILLNWEVEDTSTPLISAANSTDLASLMINRTWTPSSLFAMVECLQRLANLDKSVRLPTMRSTLV